jgi:hypothetical protein
MIYLARQSGVPVEQRDLGNYRAVTIIRKIGGEQESRHVLGQPCTFPRREPTSRTCWPMSVLVCVQ